MCKSLQGKSYHTTTFSVFAVLMRDLIRLKFLRWTQLHEPKEAEAGGLLTIQGRIGLHRGPGL